MVGEQACNEQEACRDAAMELTEELGLFIDIYGDQPQIQARTKPREAQKTVLLLVARVAVYIHDNTSTGTFGRSCRSDLVK